MITAAQLPALASARTGPTISIAARSHLAPVTGDVYVLYRAIPKYANATISGKITGATTGEVAELFAKQFPYKSAWTQVGSPITLTVTGTTAPYSFLVTPTLATRYKVELLATSSSTTALATSATDTVYVAASGKLLKLHNCVRPVCHISIKFEVFVPASTLKVEIKKPWYPYFAINFSRTAPKYLYLNAGNGHATKPARVSAGTFTVTVTYTFRVGNRGYYPGWNFCAKDSESIDGLNLPGRHGCGLKRIKNGPEYLG